MDSNQDDLNEDFKKENIEIVGNAKINPDDDDLMGVTLDPALEGKTGISDGLGALSDDELDADKMDFEPEEKDCL
ncbi:MAG: hypothetical protein AAB513_01970 [Patescibacteria group bacterium]